MIQRYDGHSAVRAASMMGGTHTLLRIPGEMSNSDSTVCQIPTILMQIHQAHDKLL